MDPGYYIAVAEIIGSRQTGSGIIFDIQALDETQRVFPYHVVMEHKNEMVVQIGLQRLADLAVACHMETIHDSEELHGKRVLLYYYTHVPRVMRVEGFTRDPLRQHYRRPTPSLLSRVMSWFRRR